MSMTEMLIDYQLAGCSTSKFHVTCTGKFNDTYLLRRNDPLFVGLHWSDVELQQ
jgi:hypothetical protein